MKLSQFKFKLPEDKIALHPAKFRDESRLMVVHKKTGEIEHRMFKDILEYFDDKDVFIFNNTKVFPARLYAKKEKTLANIEVFLLRELNHANRYWDVLVDPARKIRIGNKLFFDDDATIFAEVIDNTTSRGRTLRFLTDYEGDDFVEHLYGMGITPLPKYIVRPMTEQTYEEYEKVFSDLLVDDMDTERYQTVFADKIGAVAAPAAGMHFSKNLLKRLEIRGVETKTLTSHVGLGNFKPVDVEDLTKHKVESEQIIIPQSLVDAVNQAQEDNRTICAVGTEVMRALEHVVGTNGQIKAYDGWTNKFIYPPYNFTVANAFFVNFYMPQSTQMIMVATYGGYDNVMKAYKEAVKEGYRFGDYGDAMLILND
jgi:S-adenosylmethionine:tRNA ribosyltransferase-isomerase